jgi:hypothetical protein
METGAFVTFSEELAPNAAKRSPEFTSSGRYHFELTYSGAVATGIESSVSESANG